MTLRKRKQTQQPPEADFDNDYSITDDVDAPDATRQPIHDRLEKEREVWEAFREEHFEAIEQLPLTLHRQYALMHELDQQANGFTADILPMLQKYILKRREMAPLSMLDNVSTTHGEVEIEGHSITSLHLTPMDASDSVYSPVSPVSHEFNNSTQQLQSEARATQQTNPAAGVPPTLVKNLTTTRKMLSHIACLTEELLRASDEKVNIAQAAYDSVDRHCRILQQAIRDQESSIALGPRPSHLPPDISDLHAARLTRQSRMSLSPIEGEDPGVFPSEDQENVVPASDSIPLDQDAQDVAEGKKSRVRRKGRPQKQDESLLQAMPLTITLPAQPVAAAPEEETYCYCNQGSFGEMIACDDKKCVRGWYHLKCVDLDTAPDGRWYCPDCQPKHRRKRK